LRLDFRDADPEIIDISPKGGVVATLKESRIECLANDKVRVRVLHLRCHLSE
jgi:ATP-dependent RNA helicase DDX24/MAK5